VSSAAKSITFSMMFASIGLIVGGGRNPRPVDCYKLES